MKPQEFLVLLAGFNVVVSLPCLMIFVLFDSLLFAVCSLFLLAPQHLASLSLSLIPRFPIYILSYMFHFGTADL